MPSIPIHPPNKSTTITSKLLPQLLQTPSGLAILELQGTIHVPPLSSEEDQPTSDAIKAHAIETPVGKLIFPNYSPANPASDTKWMKHAYLYVGKHQRLTGEVKKLPKAIGIMRKKKNCEANGLEELEIVEIVKHKIVFTQRPEPVGNE
jgi:chromosome transmission fidelity protein 8